MIILVSAALGVTASLTRSAISVIIVAALIALVFLAALLTSGGANPLHLPFAIAGYNAGICLCLGAIYALDRMRGALAAR